MDQNKAKALIDKYLKGQCTPAEQAQVEIWYNQLAAGQHDEIKSTDYQEIYLKIKAGLPADPNVTSENTRLWPRVAAAAAILIFIGIGFFFYRVGDKKEPQPRTLAQKDLEPGGNKAVLTLSNGQKIALTNAKNGMLASQGQTKINKTGDGLVIYEASKFQNHITSYNTMTTPRGGQYQLVLADGTKVWLNAASSIKYPTAFAGKDREVEITGEAYFEVAKDATRPFRVHCTNQMVEVLGTHFNINAYLDEPFCKTTLLEGKVRIVTGNNQVLLSAGEQAQLNSSSVFRVVKDPDLEKVMAWKNGEFFFSGEDMKAVMRTIARWYDVDVSYTREPDTRKYGGMVSRSKNISAVLKMLESTGRVHFKIEERRVIAMPN